MQLASGARRGFFVEAGWVILVAAGALVACGLGTEQSPAVAVAHDVHTQQKSEAVETPLVARTQRDAQPSPDSAPAADASQALSPRTSRERLEVFWLAFRTAVERGDKEALADLARFPFETRGSDDSNPVRKHDRAALIAMLDKLLDQESGYPHGPRTLRELILSRSMLTDREYAGGTQAGVGDFSFVEQRKQWRFARAYTDLFEN